MTGGATSAGIQAYANNEDIGDAMLKGALQGAQNGAISGTAMAGLGMAKNKVKQTAKDTVQAVKDWRDSGDSFGERLSNTLENNDTWGANFVKKTGEKAQRVKDATSDVVDKLKNSLTEQNKQQLAYAGADGGQVDFDDISSIENPSIKNNTIIKGGAPDGSDLVKIDNTVFEGVPNNAKAKSQALKEYLQGLRGQDLPLNYGEDGTVSLTNRGIDEVSRTGTINTRGQVAGNLDEVLEVSKVNPNEPISADTKNRQFAKDGFEYRETYVDVDGDVYKVRSNIALNDGDKVFHTLNKYSEDGNTPVQLGESSTGSSGGISNSKLSRTSQNVNAGWDNLAQEMGFRNYDDAVQQFRQANPNAEVNANNVTSWMDDMADAGTTNTLSRQNTTETAKTTKEARLRQKRNEALLEQYGTIDKPTARAVRASETIAWGVVICERI